MRRDYKQEPLSSDYLESLAINALLPHRLAKYSELVGARLIHFSTDCVFLGNKGPYKEDDLADANDLYGRSKLLGEVRNCDSVTLRTSIIGHELTKSRSLVDWFGSDDNVYGYANAFFSGLPTVEVARIIKEFVIPNNELKGLYHLSVEPISKHNLLSLISKAYNKDIKLVPDSRVKINRSLNSDRFRKETGFCPRPWTDLVEQMHSDYTTFGNEWGYIK